MVWPDRNSNLWSTALEVNMLSITPWCGSFRMEGWRHGNKFENSHLKIILPNFTLIFQQWIMIFLFYSFLYFSKVWLLVLIYFVVFWIQLFVFSSFIICPLYCFRHIKHYWQPVWHSVREPETTCLTRVGTRIIFQKQQYKQIVRSVQSQYLSHTY